MAETLVNTFKPFVGGQHPIESIVLIPSGNGRYEVTVDDELIYSKAATGIHTTNEFIVDGNVHDTHKLLDVTPGQGRPSYILKGQPVRMHVFLDRQLIEVFINGQTWTTSVIDRNPCFNGIDLFTEEGYVKCTRLDIWDLDYKKGSHD